jgi:hypothetical protein
MNRHRDKLHLRLTAVAFVAAIGLPLLLHKPADADRESALELRSLARCVATVLAIGDLGPHARVAVLAWLCPPPSDPDRWIDALR